MKKTLNIVQRTVLAFGMMAQAAIAVMVLLVAGDVVLRYAFSFSPVSLQELEWHLISPIALIGMSYAVHYKADVRVDFIYSRMSRNGKCIVDVLSGLLMACVGFYLAWLSVDYVIQSYVTMEGSPDPGGLTNRWILKSFLPLGFGLLGLQGLSVALEAIDENSRFEPHINEAVTPGA